MTTADWGVPWPWSWPDATDDRPSLLARWSARRATRQDARIDAALARRDVIDLSYRWRAACPRAGLCRPVGTVLGGQGLGDAPRITHVEPGSWGVNGYFIVEMPPGLTLGDLEDGALELAAALGVWSVSFERRSGRHVRVDLIACDPLTELVPFLPAAPADHLVLGVDERGAVVSIPLDKLTHAVVQGGTGTGKSWAIYAWLAQLAKRAQLVGDVDVVGVDPTGLVLGPWGPHPHSWRASGTDDAAMRYELALRSVVDEMDRRIATMPPRCDSVPISPACPLLVAVLEEWPATARIMGHTRNKPAETHKLVGRLVSEGRKAGVRVITMAQRADSEFVGSFERDQALTRISFGCSDVNTAKMLHPAVTPELIETHAQSAVGVGLLSMPGTPLLRFRSPAVGSYGAYVDAVSEAA